MRQRLIVLLSTFVLAACTAAPTSHWVAAGGSPTPSPTPSGLVKVAALAPLPTPGRTFPVSSQEVVYSRDGRRLRTVIYTPDGLRKAPAVLFSHGLNGTPEDFAPLLTHWAAAGFVVIAPAYPNTNRDAAKLDIADVLQQPADASYVLGQVLAGPLGGRIDPTRLAAAGHSAGAITTVGLFATGRDARLHAGIILAGSAIGIGGAFSGTPAALLFVHGDADPLIPYADAKATYDQVPWSKALLTLPGQAHTDPYQRVDSTAFRQVSAATLAFLQLELYGDQSARRRLPTGKTFDNHL